MRLFKRFSIILVVALIAALFGGCRFAIVEHDAIRVVGNAALAEWGEGESLFIIDEPDLSQMEKNKDKLAKATEKAIERMESTDFVGNPPVRRDRPEESDEAEAAEPGFIGLHSSDGAGESRVRKLQQRLIDLGYLNIEADGVFGSKTLKALKRFQHDNGLSQTGVLDDETKAVLYPAPAVTTAPDEVLYSEGDFGSAVRGLQKKLRQYGFSSRPVNGNYDDATADEVMDFQVYAVEYYGTEFDDPVQAAELPMEPALVANDAVRPTPTPLPTPTPEPVMETAIPQMPAPEPLATLRPYHAVDGVVSHNLYAFLTSDRFGTYRVTVQRGDKGDEVLRVQRRLTTLDYFFEDADGAYGESTAEAVMSFQRDNALQETGIADEETQRMLFSADAYSAEEIDQPYYIKVSIDDQRVYVYRWADGGYNRLIRTMICSIGMGNSTPRGVFVSPGHRDSRWHYFAEYRCWAQYAFIIRGNILFHSVIYSRKDESSVRQSTIRNLGRKASHGCVRLPVEDARWIYENCTAGQVVEIY